MTEHAAVPCMHAVRKFEIAKKRREGEARGEDREDAEARAVLRGGGGDGACRGGADAGGQGGGCDSGAAIASH